MNERPSARARLARMFSRKKKPQPRAQPDVNVLPAPVLVPPTQVPPATEVPPPATAAREGHLPAAGAGGARAEMPRTPRPAVSPGPPLAPRRAAGPTVPTPAAEYEAVEFEEVCCLTRLAFCTSKTLDVYVLGAGL